MNTPQRPAKQFVKVPMAHDPNLFITVPVKGYTESGEPIGIRPRRGAIVGTAADGLPIWRVAAPSASESAAEQEPSSVTSDAADDDQEHADEEENAIAAEIAGDQEGETPGANARSSAVSPWDSTVAALNARYEAAR